ncbi:hypothetical protein [Tunicatimonas pelagia]|uniref:hypothetical protein n=1 Tax=Tunicatimonas pelagia TaxID=931531 RepID=UPI0026666DE8|nr:hypothetical protein [Tunicatimonas pelagia]WKN41472.1 hypothetical protein P0M28_20770 [Tunicatimonas pelagia]
MPASDKKYLQNAYEYFHRLNVTFYLLIAGPLVGFCYAYLQQEAAGGLQPTVYLSWVHLALMIGAALVILLGYRNYQRALQTIDTDWSFQEKLAFFYHKSRELHLYFMLSNALAALGLYLTGEHLFAGVYAIVLVVFSLFRPTPRRIVRDLKLTKAEKEKLVGGQDYGESNPEES